MCPDNMEKISIIVPVYNVENYLAQCLESILNQSYRNIEILCVDDGSTDKSAEILREYKNKDSRVRIISQKNQGQGTARNRGIDEARGEYITFFDADDWCDPDYYKIALPFFEKQKDVDFIMVGSYLYDEQTKTIQKDQYHTLEVLKKRGLERPFTLKDLGEEIFSLSVVPWNKIFRTSFLKARNIKFIEGYSFEDNAFSCEVFFQMTSFRALPNLLIYYRINRVGSDVQSKNQKYLDFIFQLKEMKKILIRLNCYKSYKTFYWYHVFGTLDRRCQELDYDLQGKFFQRAREWIISEKEELSFLNETPILQANFKKYIQAATLSEFKAFDRVTWKTLLFRKKIRPTRLSYYVLGIPVYRIRK